MLDTFDQFVADRLDRLLRFATALTCDPHLAQDVVQEVLAAGAAPLGADRPDAARATRTSAG